jgi:hypothetical protein
LFLLWATVSITGRTVQCGSQSQLLDADKRRKIERRGTMTRDYIGTGHGQPTKYDVYIEQDGARNSLTHSVLGSYVTYQWDGGGPGSAELARALLWVSTGSEPEWRVARLFKSEVVAAWPRAVGECWRISDEEIQQWLAGVERDTAHSEDAHQTEARLGETRHRQSRLKGFLRTFTKTLN